MPAAKSTTVKTPAKKTVRVPKKTVTTPEEVNLNAYVPSPDVAARYVGRKVHGGVWDAIVLRRARETKRNVLLMGDTGSGKTMLGEAFASKEGVLYYSVPCDVSIDPTALFGKMQMTDQAGVFEWQDGPVTEVVRRGGVLNISEINFMPPKIAASLYPLLDGRRYIPLLGHKGEVVRAHDDLLIIADMNPGYRGTLELNAAFKNRFDIKIPWGYDDAVEAKLVPLPTLLGVAKKIRAMVGTEIATPVSTNMLMEFADFAQDGVFGLEFAIGNFVAAFESDEQDAVKKVFDLEKPVLAREVTLALSASSADEDEDIVEYEFEEA